MSTRLKPHREPKTTAKLFMHGRTQAVRPPKEFRFEGKEGDNVILEPLAKPPFDFDAWQAKLDEFRDVPFPYLPDDPPVEPDDTLSFD